MQKLCLFVFVSFFFFGGPALCQPLVASFLTASGRDTARSFFDGTGDLFAYDKSAAKVECDNMPIEFNPQPSPEKYAASFGLHKNLLVLGYAHDKHAQALLVYNDPGTGADYVPSVFNDPFVTISDSNAGVYTTVYSVDLWNRLEAAGIIYCFRDQYGKPYEFVLRDQQAESWLGVLPAYNSTISSAQYPPTHAFVRHFSTYVETPLLEAVICVDYNWNRSTDTCDVQ